MTITSESWRDVLPVHPAADLFPMMSAEELRELGEDIKTNGMRVFIKLIEVAKSPIKVKGTPVQLLDGRNRLDALEATGHRIDFRRMLAVGENLGIGHLAQPILWSIESSIADPYAYVLSANIHRRHLTADQKRELITKILKAKPQQSNRAIAKQTKTDHKTVAAVRAKAESTGEIPQLKKTKGKDGKERPRRKPKPANLPALTSTLDEDGRLSMPDKLEFPPPKAKRKPVEQKVFDSPQEAHAKIEDKPKLSKRDFEQLEQSWREVHAQIKAGNNSRLHDALEIHTVIARDILVRIRAKAGAA